MSLVYLVTKFASYYIYFESLNESATPITDSDSTYTDEEQARSSSIFYDNSVYYNCESGEFISILGLCDGNIDCFYGDDEVNCKADTGSYYSQCEYVNLYYALNL